MGGGELTVHKKGMFFQFVKMKSKIKMRFNRPGPATRDFAYVAMAALRAMGPIATFLKAVASLEAPGAIVAVVRGLSRSEA